MKKVLIFGISGFVGNYLAQEFISHGYMVYGSDIHKDELLPEGILFYEADILDAHAIKNLITKVEPDMIINLAAISSVGMSWNLPQKTISINVIGALNIMETVKQCAWSPKVMLVGSSEEYAPSDVPISEKGALNANNPYGISKMVQEKFASVYREHYNMRIYCVRSFNHTGIGQKETFAIPSFCKQIAQIEKSGQAGVIKVGNLSAKRDFTNVKDIVRGYRMIIESDDCENIYNIGSGQSYTMREILDYIISLTSQSVTVETDPLLFRPLDNAIICCDNSLIEKKLGWKPKYDIFETVNEMYNYYLNDDTYA